MVIFTHCHSSTVINILKKAKQMKKSFEVHNTETRPLFQGRTTAKELSKLNIPVTHYVDSAMRLALKKADIVLLGADAITPEKAINKIGSEVIAELANKYDIPVYVCCNSWKFDYHTIFGFEEEIETRKEKEIWKNPPKNTKICNYAFEKINLNLVTAIISEIGDYRPSVFIEEIKRNNDWMCNNL
ncbi:MAG: ribose 1,5-bisphosphate isomerase, partial [Candidatus Woesearchaeota archaeon]|nr:ribose 1,5-bisphosphate isomerase [Candidatus Woesearchaeota archaeon]